jgi:hypothetical protein
MSDGSVFASGQLSGAYMSRTWYACDGSVISQHWYYWNGSVWVAFSGPPGPNC